MACSIRRLRLFSPGTSAGLQLVENHYGQIFSRIEAHNRAHAGHASIMADTRKPVFIGGAEESQRIELFWIFHWSSRTMHKVNRLIIEDLLLIGEVVLQVEHGEPNQIVRAGIHCRCAQMIERVKRERTHFRIVPGSGIALQTRPNPNRGMSQTQRRENQHLHSVGITHVGDKRDHMAQNPKPRLEY